MDRELEAMDHYLPAHYPAAFGWGVVVILGLIGLGRLVARVVDAEAGPKAGWGLHAVWGMAAYLFVGAILAVFGAFGSIAITLLVCAGAGVTFWTSFQSWTRGGMTWKAIPWQMWPAFLVVALSFSGGIVYWTTANPCDDLTAYFYFCEKLVTTGSFDEPFSWRRLASLGGHTLLQSSVVAQTSLASADAFELALCPVILLGLIVGFRGGLLSRTRLGLAIALAAVTTPIIRANSASYLTGTVLILGLFMTLDIVDRLPAADQRRRLRWLGLSGFVAAAACSLRPQNVTTVGGALGIFWLASWIRDRRPRQEMVVELGCWGGVIFVALLPWMIMGYRSNGSPIFPLFQGGNNLDFNPQGAGSLFARLAFPVRMILHPALLPLLLCLFALPGWRRGLASRAVAISATATALLLAYSLTLAPDRETIPRYVQPLLLAGAIGALLTAATNPRSRLPAWAMALLLVGTTLQSRIDYLTGNYLFFQQSPLVRMPFNTRAIADHQAAQALVPAGRRVLVCSDDPFLFDLQRNPIWNIDMPNAASPEPGLPFEKPPEEMRRYFRDQGIEYVIFTDFAADKDLYSRPIWEKHAQGDVALWRIQAPYYLDFFKTMDSLAASDTVLGRVGRLTVLQLK
jgi:hypothetical protein